MVSAAKATAVRAKPVTATGPPTAIMRSSRVRAPISGTVDWISARAKARTSAKCPASTMRGRSPQLWFGCHTPFAFRLSATSLGI